MFLYRHSFSVDIFDILLNVYPDAATLLCHTTNSLPIHAVLRNSNIEMISTVNYAAKALLVVYPGAADQTDSVGFLPLHLLVSRVDADIKIMNRLIEIYPIGVEAVTTSEDTQYLPLHCAMMSEKLSKIVIETIIEGFPEAIQFKSAIGMTPVDYLFLNLKRRYEKAAKQKIFETPFKPGLVAADNKIQFINHAIPDRQISEAGGAEKELMLIDSLRNMSPDSVISADFIGESDISNSISSMSNRSRSITPLKSIFGSEMNPEDIYGNNSLDTNSASSHLRDFSDKNSNEKSSRCNNSNISAYFSGKADGDVLSFVLELLHNNDYEVTNDILLMFGTRVSNVVEESDEMQGFGIRSEEADMCQCLIQ